MTESRRYLLALTIIAIAVAELLFLGLQSLSAPKLFQLAYRLHPILTHQGPVLVVLAILLAWFHEWAARKLIWLFAELYRWISTAIMLGIMSVEAMMHIFSIPHLEGWWVPLLGGSAIITAVTAWFQKSKPNSVPSQHHPRDHR